MRNLIQFIIRFHFVFLFLLLEVISFTLAVNSSSHHNQKFFSSANYISGSLYSGIDAISQYFNLTTVNKSLAIENRVLRNNLKSYFKENKSFRTQVKDSVYMQQYSFIEAKVLNNSINRQQNFLTLNKGSKHGVKADMAVITSTGVVGIIDDVTKNFSTVVSLLNVNYKVSAKLKKNNYFGSLYWAGEDYRFAELSEIPFHVDVQQGDTIVTNGYSAIYPEGELIGVVEEFSKSVHDNFYSIKVRLITDFQNVEFVYIINDLLKEERLTLEKSSAND